MALRQHDRIRLSVIVAPPPSSHPSNAAHPWGGYLRVHERDGLIIFASSDESVPVAAGMGGMFARMVTVAPGHEPRLLASAGEGSLPVRVVFAVEGSGGWNVQETISHDDGATWTDPATVIPGGRHPDVAKSAFDAERLYAAYVGPNDGPGVIKGKRIGAGDDPAAATLFTFKNADGGADLSVADDTFGIDQGVEGSARWVLHVLISGESATSDWWSGSDARFWTRIGTAP